MTKPQSLNTLLLFIGYEPSLDDWIMEPSMIYMGRLLFICLNQESGSGVYY